MTRETLSERRELVDDMLAAIAKGTPGRCGTETATIDELVRASGADEELMRPSSRPSRRPAPAAAARQGRARGRARFDERFGS